MAFAVCWAAGASLAVADDDGDERPRRPSAAELTEEVGWMRRNSTHPEVDAPYSLVETGGLIRCYMRPAPGVDLDQFVNRKVRVRGAERRSSQQAATILEVTQIGPPDALLPPPTRGPDRNVTRTGFENTRQAYTEEVPTPARRPAADADVPGSAENPFNDEVAPGPNAPAGEPDMPGHGPHGPGDPGWDGDPNFGGTGPSCSTCGGCGHPTCGTCCHGCCGPPGRIWVRLEYLYWFTEGMRIPPLVTTGPSAAQPGYLDTPGTTILYGGSRVDGYGRSGGRLTTGLWLDCAQTIGIEGDFFALANATSYYSATSNGNPILSRPFFDTRPTLINQNVEQVASPGVISGTVTGNTYTRFSSAGARFLFNICCGSKCYANSWCPSFDGPGAWRLDFLVGYRYLNLSDGVIVNENLSTVAQPAAGLPAGTFNVNDTFTTRNQFNGAELGAMYSLYRGNRWSFEFLEKVALGNMNELATINGFTTSVPAGGTATTLPGGLLAQSSNIGNYTRNEFAVIPQFGLNLGYQITPRLRALVGYTFLYVSRVARAGDQIDINVNSTLLPNSPTPPSGDIRHPMFAFQDTDFWAQGINAGLDYRF